MKKTNIAKRIVSVLLAMSIVLSFALVSVSALPTDYTVVDEKYEFIDFEDNVNTMISTSGGTGGTKSKIENGTAGKDTHSGTHSTMITAASNGHLKIWYTPFKNTSYAGWEANSTYYMSFWFYSDTWACDTTIWGDDGYTYTASFSAKTTGQWNKAVLKITTGASPAAMGFPIGAYNLGVGNTIYFDDFEVAKVEDFTNEVNTLPAGASSSKQAILDWDTVSVSLGVTLATTTGVKDRYVTMDNAHWGDRSLAYPGIGSDTTFYFHPRLLMPSLGMTDDILPTGKYWFSFYVYSPNCDVTVSAITNKGSAIAPTKVTQGSWQKVSGCYIVKEADNNALNNALFNITLAGIGSNTVYLDDFLFAEITTEALAFVGAGDVEYDFAAGNKATVKFTSTTDLNSATVTPPEGLTVESSSVAGNVLTVELSGVTYGTDYALTVDAVDIFSGSATGASLTFTTPSAGLAPMEIAASSIEDGATDVMAPVSYIYIDAPYALNTATVIAENFTITGRAASVTAVEPIDADTIKVSLANVLPENTYTLAVDNVANTDGGILTDSIKFTTIASAPMYSYNMEGSEKAEYLQKGIAAYDIDFLNTDCAHSGLQSIKLVPLTDYFNGRSGMWINGLPRNNVYQISFYIKSDVWTERNNGVPLFDEDRGDIIAAPVVGEADANGWRKVTVVYMPITDDGALMVLNGLGLDSATNTAYIDDIEVIKVAGTIAQPVIIAADGSYDDAISAGAKVEIPVAANVVAGAVKVFVVQYDANNKMISAPSYTNAGSGAAISFTVPDTADKTKVIIMNATTYAPLCDAYAMNY